MRYVRHPCQAHICLGPILRSDIPISHHSFHQHQRRSRLCLIPHLRLVTAHLVSTIVGFHLRCIILSYHPSFLLHSCLMITTYHAFYELMIPNSYLGLFLSSRCPTLVPVSPSWGASFLFISRPLILSADPLELFKLLVFPHNLVGFQLFFPLLRDSS